MIELKEKSSRINLKKFNLPEGIQWYDLAFFGIASAAVFFLTGHPDLWETSNHSYVLLESIFSGRFLDFYNVVAAHENTYYYLNGANYNIFVYIIFALWQLPVFIINSLFSLPMNEFALLHWSKLLCCGFYLGCGIQFKLICQKLGLSGVNANLAVMFLLFNPISFFSPVAMGQYDTLCLFFTLWSLRYYLEGRYQKFSFILGIGVVCKFFPLLIFLPLILLAEKRILKLMQYGVTALWLFVPTTLLFMGRTGEANSFTTVMINRLFLLEIPTGTAGISAFITLYALLVFLCFIYSPKAKEGIPYLAMYVSMAVFGLLFTTMNWHPQWLVLFIPFVVATTFMQRAKAPWHWLDIVMAGGFFFTCFYHHVGQIGAVLFEEGWLRTKWHYWLAVEEDWAHIDFLLRNVPYVKELAPVMLFGAVAANILFKFPLKGISLADRLCDETAYDNIPHKVFLYLVFVAGFILAWAVPSALEFMNAFGIVDII